MLRYLSLLLVFPSCCWSLDEHDLRDPISNQSIIRYALELPADIPEGRQLPLIVCFHGTGGRASHHANLVLHCLDRLGLRDHLKPIHQR